MKNNMEITVVDINDRELFEGVKVRNKKTGNIRTIRSYPTDMTISEAVAAGIINPNTDIDYSTVMLNKTHFELIVDDELLKFDHKQKVIDAIINMVDIRGIDLSKYRRNFEESGVYEELEKLFKTDEK